MASFDMQGKVKLINDTQTFDSGFCKREFVLTDDDDKYPQDIKFEVVKDNCDKLDDYNVGDEIEVGFNLRGNEYNDKYYVNLQAWRLKLINASGVSQAVLDAADDAQKAVAKDDDDLPF